MKQQAADELKSRWFCSIGRSEEIYEVQFSKRPLKGFRLSSVPVVMESQWTRVSSRTIIIEMTVFF